MNSITFDLLWSKEKFQFGDSATEIRDIPLFNDINSPETQALLNQDKNGFLTFLTFDRSPLGDPSDYFKHSDLERIREALQGAVTVLMNDYDEILSEYFEEDEIQGIATDIITHLLQYKSEVFKDLYRLSRFDFEYEVHSSHEAIEATDPYYIDNNDFEIVSDCSKVILLKL